jgi:hypothetical protein
MAENTKIWPIFRWANWGLSDDLFTGIRNSFYFSNNMEIREDAKSIFPKWIPAYADNNTKVIIWDGDDGDQWVKNVTHSKWDGWLIVCNKDIYSVNFNTKDTELLCTLPEQICDLELFNWYIYISTKTNVYYKKDNWLYWTNLETASDDSDDDYGVMTQTLASNGTHPLYASEICLCVWDTNKLWKVTREIYKQLQVWFEIPHWYYIRFINELWWFVRVTAVDEPYGSEVLLWDKVSDAPTEIIPIEWFSILWSIIYWGYHYLLSQRWLWLLNWYQYYILKKAEVNVDSDTRNCMCVYDDKLYFVANNWVYIYWAKNKNYADVLWLWHKVEDWFTLWAIWADNKWILVTRNYRYQSWWIRTPIVVWYNTWLATTWEVQTMCYYGTSMSEIKQSMYLRVGYHLWKEWDNSGDIHIYYRTEADATTDNPEDWQWHPVQSNDVWLSAVWDMRSPFATSLKLNCRFQWIQFKFVITNCVWQDDDMNTYTKDTNLYSADLYYNDMLD